MKFNYTRFALDDDRQRLPIARITIVGRDQSIDSDALIDSGSDHNIFDESIAHSLEIPLGDAEPVVIGALGCGL